MENLPAGAENDPRAPWNDEEEFECTECGDLIPKEGLCGSTACFKASML